MLSLLTSNLLQSFEHNNLTRSVPWGNNTNTTTSSSSVPTSYQVKISSGLMTICVSRDQGPVTHATHGPRIGN